MEQVDVSQVTRDVIAKQAVEIELLKRQIQHLQGKLEGQADESTDVVQDEDQEGAEE